MEAVIIKRKREFARTHADEDGSNLPWLGSTRAHAKTHG